MTKKFKLIRKRVALFALTAVMGISSMSCTKDAKNVSSKSLPKEPDKSHSIAIEDHSITDFEEQFTYEEQENLNNVGGGFKPQKSAYLLI